MRFLWIYLFLQWVSAQAGFGTSYLGNSHLCHEWTCLNGKLNLPDALPPKDHYSAIVKSLLPQGSWQDVVDPALDVCYGKKPRRYTNTCPGQALMHCFLDQLIQNCPFENWKKEDGCAQLSSFNGMSYMFSQSRYEDLENNLAIERRPSWFLKKYFKDKCCDVPPLLNDTTLHECGLNKFMFYHIHATQRYSPFGRNGPRIQLATTTTSKPIVEEGLQIQEIFEEKDEQPEDPLDCCDMKEFIKPEWRSECDFGVNWDVENRLTIRNNSESVIPTTATPSLKTSDVKLVPISCESQNCIYSKLNIISESGEVDKDALSNLLDNMTKIHPTWVAAKDRAVMQCLNKKPHGYDADCQINKILACVFDVMTENCPYDKDHINPCIEHSTSVKEGIICQISSSKYRPRNRRQFCNIPNFINENVLRECNVPSLFKLEYVPEPIVKMNKWKDPVICRELTRSTTCVMNKMGVLNKYSFIDYFKMKEKIRAYTESVTPHLHEIYNSAFQNGPFYKDSCSSPKKLLNVIDSILMTCPLSRRKTSNQCNKVFTEMKNSIPNVSKEKFDGILRHFQNIYLPDRPQKSVTESPRKSSYRSNPIYNFGIVGDDAPPVQVIDIKPKEKTLVLLPVYQRMPTQFKFPINSLHNDGVLRSAVKP